MLSEAEQRPRPPATAYNIVAPMLPSSYFMEAPPQRPMIVSVTSMRDQVRTEWAMSDRLAGELTRSLSVYSGLHVSTRREG